MHIGETREDLSLAAADILEPVLRKGSFYDKLVQILEMRARAKAIPPGQSSTLKADGQGARRVARAGKRCAVGADPRSRRDARGRADLYAEIDRLAAASGGYGATPTRSKTAPRAFFDARLPRTWRRLARSPKRI